MSAHAEAVGVHAHDHHGPPAANQSSRLAPTILGMFIFIGSEAMLFGSFFTAYFFVRVINPSATIVQPERWQHWLPCKEPLVNGVCQAGYFELPVFVAGINTAILVTSSFTMHWALQSIKRNNRRGLQAGLVLTILMGAAFLLTQMIEYAHVGLANSCANAANGYAGASAAGPWPATTRRRAADKPAAMPFSMWAAASAASEGMPAKAAAMAAVKTVW